MRWSPPLALAVGSLAALGGAVALEAGAAADPAPVGGARLRTPVLSVRRVPEVVAAPIAERRLLADLSAWVATQPVDSCLVVVDDEDEVSFDHRGNAPLVPASTAKLVTATAALRQLGPDTRFRTVATAAAPPDAATGALRGDLVLVGGGDPLLASPDYVARFERQPQVFTDLDQLAASVAAAGVRRVEGSVVGDESRYDRVRSVPGWPPRYIEQDQIGPLSALAVNDGFAVYPLSPDVFQELEAAEEPAADAAAVLTRLLEARGVDVIGAPRAGAAVPGLVELAAVESPPMSEVVGELLRESDNSTAELLLKELGRAAGDPSTAGGRAVVATAVAEAGVDAAGLIVADGSGLALENRVTCRLLVEVLQLADVGPVLDDGLPVAGRTGTLADRFEDTDLQGHLRAKTGSLNTVTALAGTVEDGDGTLTFALVVNAPRVSPEVVASQAALAEALLAWPRLPDRAELRPLPVRSP